MDTRQDKKWIIGEQLLLFQDQDMLFNRGVLELARLNLEAARAAFDRYEELYHDGDAIDPQRKLTDFLIESFSGVPDSCPEKPAHIYGVWTSFKTYVESGHSLGSTLLTEMKYSFFKKIREAIEECSLTDPFYIADEIPVGYVYIQLKEYSLAIQSLQACIRATPDNAAIHGYLGDAYILRGEMGDTAAARQCLLEASLIDPLGIDWPHIKDAALLELKDQIIEEHDLEEPLALEWLPSYAYVTGIFEPKTIKPNEGLGEFVDEYLNIKRAYEREQTAGLKARLFLRSMILCDNEDSLRYIKGIDFMDIRRVMKDVNPELFRTYLDFVERRNRSRVKWCWGLHTLSMCE